ncbi:MAG: dihydrolipoyl dehydrogenase family protein [Solirubrobacterales bacterium]
MKPEYDLVALGGGTAGLVATLTVAEMGGRAALIEEDRPGGDCLYTGCVPSKTVIASAELAHRMRTADAVALEPSEPSPDFGRVLGRINETIAAAGTRDDPEYLQSKGVEVVKARGRFTAPGRIEADGRELRFRVALIATGSAPAIPPIPGLDRVDPLTNKSLFELRKRPGHLAVLGGGPIGTELGQALARLGSRVSVVEAMPQLLPREEREAGELLAGTLADEGVDVHTATRVAAVHPGADGSGRLMLSPSDSTAGDDVPTGDATSDVDSGGVIEFDRILVATGRTPVTDDLGLDAVGVELDERGAVKVNDRLATSGSHIYAAGDVVGGLQFTHVAAYHGLVAVANGLFRARRKAETRWIPWVTFTDPEIARVGLTEEEARQRLGEEPLVFKHDRADLDRALTAGRPHGFSKLVADRKGRLLGATVAGHAAGETVGELARLVRDKGKVADVSQMVYAYPTYANGVQLAANDWWAHKYFTPKGKRRFQRILSLLRRIDRPR